MTEIESARMALHDAAHAYAEATRARLTALAREAGIVRVELHPGPRSAFYKRTEDIPRSRLYRETFGTPEPGTLETVSHDGLWALLDEYAREVNPAGLVGVWDADTGWSGPNWVFQYTSRVSIKVPDRRDVAATHRPLRLEAWTATGAPAIGGARIRCGDVVVQAISVQLPDQRAQYPLDLVIPPGSEWIIEVFGAGPVQATITGTWG